MIIHTSFVERILKEKAKGRRSWKCAIDILRANHKYDGDKLAQIDELRELRNIILHDLLKDEELTNKLIASTLKKMERLLKDIYRNSALIQHYLSEHYGIDARTFK